MEYPDSVVCYQCHSFLERIDQFKRQVEQSFRILNTQSQHLKTKNTKAYNIQQTKIEIFSTLDPELTDKEEIKNEEDHIDSIENITTEIKIEHDSSDFETCLPLSQIKKEKKKRVRKKKETRAPLQEKYNGKIKIIILSREEMMAERQRDAVKESYLNLPYKCENCITGFDHELTLKDHIDKRHSQKQGGHICDICKSVLSTESSYKEHTKRHFRRYECEVCGKRNNNVYSVVKHYNERHGTISTQFTCQDCGFTTESNRSYRYHRDKHKEKPQCAECGNTFVNRTGLRIHMFTVHKHSSRVYSCEACGKVYNAKSGLLAHIQSAHSGGGGGGGGGSAYCAQCRAHFRTAHNLRHHLRTHSRHVADADRRFICDECGARFLTKSSLQEHIDWVHLKKTKHECNKCSKVFKNNSSLKKHKSFVHDKKRPPRNKICDHCGRGFTTLTILRSHIRTHTGERPLRCARCPAAFAHSAALYTHNKLLHAHAHHAHGHGHTHTEPLAAAHQ